MNRNVIPQNWYYYYDGNNPIAFKKWVLRYLNDTTTSSNEPYSGKNFPRYYGMVNGEPFVRKTEKGHFFVDNRCKFIRSTKEFHAAYDEVTLPNRDYEIAASQPMAKPEDRAGHIGSFADLTRYSWVVENPNGMVLDFINEITKSCYSGGSKYYAVMVSPKGTVTAKALSIEAVKKRDIPIYPNSVISNLLISNSDIQAKQERYIPEIQRVEHSIDNDILNRERQARVEAEANYMRLQRQINRERDIIHSHPQVVQQTSSIQNKEPQGLKTLSLDAPILIKRRKK